MQEKRQETSIVNLRVRVFSIAADFEMEGHTVPPNFLSATRAAPAATPMAPRSRYSWRRRPDIRTRLFAPGNRGESVDRDCGSIANATVTWPDDTSPPAWSAI